MDLQDPLFEIGYHETPETELEESDEALRAPKPSPWQDPLFYFSLDSLHRALR